MDDSNIFDGQHGPTGFTGRTVTSVRAEMRVNQGRNDALVSTAPATFTPSDAPTSQQFLAAQAQAQSRAQAATWYDYSTKAGYAVAGVHSDHDPAGYVAAHGYSAVNNRGEPAQLTPRQARGLIGRLLDSMARGATESISFTDDSRPPALATVHLVPRR